MSAFKEAVAADVSRVFINLDEFAEEHEIGHEVVPCILDKIITQASGNDSYGNDSHLGIFVNQLTIYVEVGVIETPVEGELLNVDGALHLVKSVSNEGGVLVIVTEGNEQ